MARAQRSRRGVRTDGRFVFRCAACGGVAATLAALDDGQPVEGGPLPGGGTAALTPPAPAYVFEFIGTTTGTASDAVAELVRESESLDPLRLRSLDGELAAFCRQTCELNYCAACWDKRIEYDEGFYDCTRGRCPSGHEQLLDGRTNPCYSNICSIR